MTRTITAETLWLVHHASLGGRSSVSGAPLPATLSACPDGAQAAHWGMALYVAHRMGLEEPPVPPGVSREKADEVRQAVMVLVSQ